MNGSSQRTVVDTGPPVALLSRGDQYEPWAREGFEQLAPPVFTCEAVFSEAQLLVQSRGGNPLAVLEMVQRGMLGVAFDVEDHVERLLGMQRAYVQCVRGRRGFRARNSRWKLPEWRAMKGTFLVASTSSGEQP